LIAQPKLRRNVDSKITFGIARVAAALVVVGSTYRALVYFAAGTTRISMENRMQGTSLFVVRTAHPMIYGTMLLWARHDQTVSIKFESIAVHGIFRPTGAINPCNKFNVLYDKTSSAEGADG